MRREIKFRAWYMPFGSKEPMQKMVHEKASSILAFAEMSPDEYIVEQYTGLKDANGKEIYEGDIVKETIEGCIRADKYLVKNMWDLHVWTEESDSYYAVSKMEVKGNVHTNPELLEADEWPRNYTQNANN